MKERWNKVKKYLITKVILYAVILIVLKLILNMFGIEFRQWIYQVSFWVICLGTIAGMIQIARKSKKKSLKILLSMILIIIITIGVIFWQIIALFYIAIFPSEHVVKKNGKQTVASVHSFLRTNVEYYKYQTIFTRENKVILYEDYGRGSFDPFDTDNIHEPISSESY